MPMIDSGTSGFLDETPQPPAPDQDGMAELRSLLIGPEQTQLHQLQERLDNPERYARDISRVLPDAITLRPTQDPQLIKALMPTVEEAIQTSVKREPRVLVDALFPVMGPAIRKAIAEALSDLLQTVNQTLEHSLSLRSLKWRWQAWRTGKSFAEIVMLNTLLYRVEQVFLIHKETGLLLEHVTAKSVVAQDADLVSGMLTAIQDFVRDSFSVPQGETLDTLHVGELTVWVEPGPHAILAGVIRGTAPPALRLIFKETIENIHREQRQALESFEGDTAPFEASRPYLENCLQEKYQAKKNKTTSPALWLLAAVILAACVLWAIVSIRDHWRWTAYLDRLRAEPGIVVTAAEKGWWRFSIAGLRDPLATDPETLLQEAKLDPRRVTSRWELYQALSPPLVLKRAKMLLDPPETVTLRVEEGTLHATGSAPHQWIIDARKLARALPGVTSFKEDRLIDQDFKAYESLKARVEHQVLRFILGTTRLVAGQNDHLRDLATDLRQLDKLAAESGQPVRVEIVGHTDSTGSESSNLSLSQDRADQIQRALVAQRIPQAILTAVGVSGGEPLREESTEQDREFNRSVSFRVTLAAAPERKGFRP